MKVVPVKAGEFSFRTALQRQLRIPASKSFPDKNQ
jgi:hypothetical protein